MTPRQLAKLEGFGVTNVRLFKHVQGVPDDRQVLEYLRKGKAGMFSVPKTDTNRQIYEVIIKNIKWNEANPNAKMLFGRKKVI